MVTRLIGLRKIFPMIGHAIPKGVRVRTAQKS